MRGHNKDKKIGKQYRILVKQKLILWKDQLNWQTFSKTDKEQFNGGKINF